MNFSQSDSRNRTTARIPTNTNGTVRDFSQITDVQLFHLDFTDCPQSAHTEFIGVRGVVVASPLNSSTSFQKSGRGHHCYWTVSVPEGQLAAAAVHLGRLTGRLSGNMKKMTAK